MLFFPCHGFNVMVLSKAGGRLVEEVQVCSRNVPGFLVEIFPRTYFGTLGNRIQAGKKNG